VAGGAIGGVISMGVVSAATGSGPSSDAIAQSQRQNQQEILVSGSFISRQNRRKKKKEGELKPKRNPTEKQGAVSVTSLIHIPRHPLAEQYGLR
jgi:hypothetical protein